MFKGRFENWIPAFAGMTKQRIIIFLVPLFLALPFINRAYFVDDSYFVEIASWLKDHPARLYDFRTDDAGLQNPGWEKTGLVRMVNPLVHHFYLAGLMKLGARSEWSLRLGCVLLACFSAVFIFELARRLTERYFLATLIALVTPVHWMTSYSLLIDSTLGFFFFGALYFFIRAIEADAVPLMLASGFFMGLAILTKYPGVLIVPLSACWLWVRRAKVVRWWPAVLAWAIGLGFLVAYSLYTKELYGAAHVWAASSRMVKVFSGAKVFVFLVFLSGAFFVPLLSWAFLDKTEKIVGVVVMSLLTVFFSSSMGGFEVHQALLLSLWGVSALALLRGAVWLGFAKQRPGDAFLLLWLAGFVGMMLVVMGWVAVRYYMIVVPAVVFIMVRLIEIRFGEGAPRILQRLAAVVFISTACVAFADYKQAEPSRSLLVDLPAQGYHGGERHFFSGDSFTMSYLKGAGWVPCFESTEFRPGDLILAKEVAMPQWWFLKRPMDLKKLAEFDYPTRFPIKVMDVKGAAGFYASLWGPLPFTFSSSPWERFHLFEVAAVESPSENRP